MTLAVALFTAAVCWALGRLLFWLLRIELRRAEFDLLAAVTGASLLSLAVFLFCITRIAYPQVLAVFGVAAVIGARWAKGGRQVGNPDRAWMLLIPLVPFVLYSVIYLSNSLAPEFSPDGTAYHLGLVARYFRQHGFERLTTNMYGNLSQGMEMLFLFAFAFGRHSAAATVHCLFLIALPVLMFLYGQRIGRPWSGACAGMLVYLSPVVGIDGVSAYNDVALATVGFALFYVLEIWRDEHDDALLIPIGLLAGFCFAIKYTGFVAILYAVLVLRKSSLKMLVSASCIALPWLVKNAVWLHNPVSPFFNRIFPNPFVHVSLEEFYRHYLSNYGLQSFKSLFWIVTVTGQLGGQIGPVFLLAPLALLSLRSRRGRQCLLAAAVFLLPYPRNIGARFLIPTLPFVAFGIALAFEFSRLTLASLVAAASVLAWPRVIDRYRAPSGGWQIVTVPWQAALRLVPEDEWLRRRYPGYRLAETINSTVPATAKIWSTMPLAESYITPDILVNYYSAEGEQIQDILTTPIHEAMQPLWNLRFTFPSKTLSHLRIWQDAISPDDIWSIGEARFFNGANEIHPVHADARPFPWDVGLALDGDPVTRWRSWESIHPGMHVDFDFGAGTAIDRVELHCSHDQWKIRLRLEGIPAQFTASEDPPLPDLRQRAIHLVRSHGIRFLMIGNEDDLAADMSRDPARWGIRLAAHTELGNLYQIP